MVLKSLSQMEIILLSKYVAEFSLTNEAEKEWYFEFNKYISSLSEKEQATIRKFKKRVQLA